MISKMHRHAAGLATAAALGLVAMGSARAETVTVPGTANIWGAGHSGAAATPAPAGQGGGTAPPSVNVAGLAVVTFGDITGEVSLGCAGGCAGGPDGQTPASPTSIAAYNGISGIFTNSRDSLLGVFVGTSEPADPAPAALNFQGGNTNFASLSPVLNQIFFIGDGLTGTGSGASQQFFVPAGAARLYFGILDGLVSGGLPGGYFNNTGSFTVNVSSVPEPSAWALMLGGAALLAARKRRMG